MSKKKIAGIIAGCIIVVIVIVVITTRPPTPEFHINVIPEQLRGPSIAGQHCIFLVTITDEGQEGQIPVRISAQAPDSQVVIYQQDIVE